jgi:hypothetical protein
MPQATPLESKRDWLGRFPLPECNGLNCECDRRVDVILLLIKHALPSADPINYGLLDIQHNRLYDAPPQDRLLPLLYGEADSFLTMWKALP